MYTLQQSENDVILTHYLEKCISLLSKVDKSGECNDEFNVEKCISLINENKAKACEMLVNFNKNHKMYFDGHQFYGKA